MELLPAQVMKLRWLLSQTEKMKIHDANYVQDIAKILADKNNHEHTHPITIVMIDGLYESYRNHLKEVSNG